MGEAVNEKPPTAWLTSFGEDFNLLFTSSPSNKQHLQQDLPKAWGENNTNWGYKREEKGRATDSVVSSWNENTFPTSPCFNIFHNIPMVTLRYMEQGFGRSNFISRTHVHIG